MSDETTKTTAKPTSTIAVSPKTRKLAKHLSVATGRHIGTIVEEALIRYQAELGVGEPPEVKQPESALTL